MEKCKKFLKPFYTDQSFGHFWYTLMIQEVRIKRKTFQNTNIYVRYEGEKEIKQRLRDCKKRERDRERDRERVREREGERERERQRERDRELSDTKR